MKLCAFPTFSTDKMKPFVHFKTSLKKLLVPIRFLLPTGRFLNMIFHAMGPRHELQISLNFFSLPSPNQRENGNKLQGE